LGAVLTLSADISGQQRILRFTFRLSNVEHPVWIRYSGNPRSEPSSRSDPGIRRHWRRHDAKWSSRTPKLRLESIRAAAVTAVSRQCRDWVAKANYFGLAQLRPGSAKMTAVGLAVSVKHGRLYARVETCGWCVSADMRSVLMCITGRGRTVAFVDTRGARVTGGHSGGGDRSHRRPRRR
jgi:hypothetical protein